MRTMHAGWLPAATASVDHRASSATKFEATRGTALHSDSRGERPPGFNDRVIAGDLQRSNSGTVPTEAEDVRRGANDRSVRRTATATNLHARPGRVDNPSVRRIGTHETDTAPKRVRRRGRYRPSQQ